MSENSVHELLESLVDRCSVGGGPDEIVDKRLDQVLRSSGGFQTVMSSIGYVKLFLFSYALSVDRAYELSAQHESLRTLVLALKRDPMAHRVFVEMDGAVLIARILRSENAKMTDEIFSVLMDLVFSDLEREVDQKVAIGSNTAIVEPTLLSTLVASSWLWKNGRFWFWVQLIGLIGDSIQKPGVLGRIKKFNLHQLEVIDFMTTLLNGMLEMQESSVEFTNQSIGNDDGGALQLATNLSSIVRILIGTPVNLNQVTKFWNYLQISHPPAETMIDHQIRGRLDWIRPDSISVSQEAIHFETSELADFLKEFCNQHPKEKVTEKLHSTNSIIAVRNEFIGVPTCRKESLPQKKSTSAFEPNDLASEFELLDRNDVVNRYDLPDDIPRTEHWLVHLRALFLELLNEIVWTCEDRAMAVIESDVVCWNSILVLLTNQKYLRIRSLIFSLLKNFLLRCDPKHRNSFSVRHGFVFLSNELRKHQLDPLTVDAVFSMTCGEPVTIFHGLDELHLHTIVYDKFKILSLYSLFTLLEESVDDSLMFWSICSTLQKEHFSMFAGDNAPRLAFFELGLTSSMTNVLKSMCTRKSGKLLNGPIFPLLDCWISFSRSIIQLSVPYKDRRVLSYCEDFLWLCLTADHQEANQPKVRPPSANSDVQSSTSTDSSVFSPQLPLAVNHSLALRRMLCHLLFAWIDAIRTVAADPLVSTTNSYRSSYRRTSSSGDSSEFELLYGESEWSYESINRLDRQRNNDKNKKQQRDFAPAEELAERLVFALERTNNVLVFLRPSTKVSDEEEALFDLHFELLSAAWKSKPGMKQDEWTNLLVACKPRAISLLGELIAFVMYPARQKIVIKTQDVRMLDIDHNGALTRRLRLAQLLASELPLNRLNLVGLLETNLDYQYALKVAIHELTFLFAKQREVVLVEYDDDLEKLGRFLRSIQIDSPLAGLTPTEINSLAKDEELLVQFYQEKERAFHRYLQAKTAAIQSGEHAFLSVVSDKAIRLTCELAEIQSPWRKKTLEWKKRMESALAKTSETICHLMRELCHPESVFYDERSWPPGFALDTTENGKRERRRLKPAHYNFPGKFLRAPNRTAEVAEGTCPLGNLLKGSLNRSALERVEANSQIRRSLSVTLIRTAFECSGEMVISDHKIFFLGDMARSTQKGKTYAPVSYTWAFDQIREIHNRSYLLNDNALELFTTTGDAFLVVFSDAEQRQVLLEHLTSLNYGVLIVDRDAQLQSANKMWRKGQITNFDYLMILNKLAGRSFNGDPYLQVKH